MIGQRLKLSGMRWTVPGAAAIATPALPGRQQSLGRDLAATPQPDRHRRTGHLPAAPHSHSRKLTPVTYKIDAHPSSRKLRQVDRPAPDDQKAELSREMTKPGTELVREADASDARSSIGSTSSSALMRSARTEARSQGRSRDDGSAAA